MTGEPVARRPRGRREPDPRRGPHHLPRAGLPQRDRHGRDAGDAHRPLVSFTLEHRLTACEPGRDAAARRDQRLGDGPLRLRDRTARPRSTRRSSRRSRPSRAASAPLSRSVDDAPEDRDRVLAAEPEAVDGDGLDPGLAGGQRHVVEVALRVGRAQVGGRRDDPVADRADARPARWRCPAAPTRWPIIDFGELIATL